MRTGHVWERIGDRVTRYAASALIRLARGILMSSQQLYLAGLIDLAGAKRAYRLSGGVWRLGWLLIRPRGRCHHRI